MKPTNDKPEKDSLPAARRENAPPKQHLYGAVRSLKEEIGSLPDPMVRARLLAWIEKIESWEPLIRDVDDLS